MYFTSISVENKKYIFNKQKLILFILDKNAFVSTNNIDEVKGEGFKEKKL
ncbi:hypothetical protein [Terrisporobacter hibernicus]|uniref:DUF2179 domain-containing protein n=1 Tax=Terrisporobacter hibernicus TaxID=2813371 RepID=A0AAX2ZF92_9FIRM|nr:hypothetical protein [Terrisporobacter hibernicus]UEL47979.1 hypothetical protein JW646_00565 [Terrisporobacter hibernicus]